jgi:hypothetical protein
MVACARKGRLSGALYGNEGQMLCLMHMSTVSVCQKTKDFHARIAHRMEPPWRQFGVVSPFCRFTIA